MGTIVEKMNYTKAQIERLKVLTNERVLESVVDNVQNNYRKGNDWQPREDWWDIDTILKNDREDFPGKMIVLLTDGVDSSTFKMNGTNKIAKVKTSDGAEYTETATHMWDKSLDKVCGVGYKTRYYIVYFSDVVATIYYDELPSAMGKQFSNLYMIVKDMDLMVNAGSGSSWFNSNNLLEYVKCVNSLLKTGYFFASNNNSLRKVERVSAVNAERLFAWCSSLVEVKEIDLLPSVTSLGYIFIGASALRMVPAMDTLGVRSFNNAFEACTNLQVIKSLNFESATSVNAMFNGCRSLVCIEEILNIKVSGLNFSACVFLNYDTLMRILSALYDFSEDLESTHTLVLGNANLLKLTDEELAIGQNKGWTIS